MANHPLESLLAVGECAFELASLDCFEHASKLRTGFPAHGDKVVSVDERRRDQRFTGELLGFLGEKLVVIEHAVAAHAIELVEKQLVGEVGARHETFEFRYAHLLHIFENHVLIHSFNSGVDLFPGKPEPLHQCGCHPGAELVVAAKTNPALGGVKAECARFADIVEKNGEYQRQTRLFWRQFEHQSRVNKDIAFRVELWGLLAAFKSGQFWKNRMHKAALIEQIEAAQPLGTQKNAHELLSDPLSADIVNLADIGLERCPSLFLDLKAECCCKAHRSKQTQTVFGETCGWVAYGADDPGFQIGPAVDEIDNLPRDGVEKHAVDREIAALGVLARIRVGDSFGVSAIEIKAIGPESGHLKLHFPFQYADHTKVCAHSVCAGEKSLYLLWARAGGDVVINRRSPSEGIANTASGVEGYETMFLQVIDHLPCGRFQGAHGETLERERLGCKRLAWGSRIVLPNAILIDDRLGLGVCFGQFK